IYPVHASRPWQPGEAITTWDVDGVIDSRNIPTDSNYNPNWEPTRGVVWGCERPELLITETFATHDRRQYDVSSDPNDPEYVNKFRPEGSLFVELYNPWSEAEARPAEFYGNVSSNPNTAGVRLNQTSPVGGSPVWRLAIYDLADAIDQDTKMPAGLGYRDPHDESLAKPPTLERLVYFVPDTGNLPEAATAKVTFSSSAADLAPVMPRRYAVVGPSNPASAQYPAGATLLGAPPATDVSALRRIVLNPNPDPTSTGQVQVFSNGTIDDLATLATAIQPPVAVAIDKARAGTAGTVQDLRLSISEPVDGYLADGDPNYNWATGYVTPQPAEDVYRGDEWGADVSGETPSWGGPLGTAGCTPALRYVHLQRLANPLLPYHDTTNPYMSIDSAPVDLTVFDSQMDAKSHAWGLPGSYVIAGTPSRDSLVTRQRGQDNVAAKSAAFWTAMVVPNPEPTNGLPIAKNSKPLGAGADPANVHFRGDLGHSLGYLNDFFFDQSPLDPGKFTVPLVYGGAPGAEVGSSGTLTFTPDPLPWLTWLNRPFANPLELLQVPALHSSRLLLSYENDVTRTAEVYTSGKESFAHLGPFFSAFYKDTQTEKNSGKLRGVTGEDATPWTSLVPNFYRLLEYVHVPSRFVDAQVQGNPGLMNNPGEPHVFHPPFHFIPTYREPGKINLNTIFDHSEDLIGNQPIYRALANDHALPLWEEFVKARRGYASVAAGDPDPDYGLEAGLPALPTRFANPFRSFAGQGLVPPVPGRDPGGTDPLYLQQIVQEGINATLLRAQHGTADPPPPLDQRLPLFTAAATPNPAPYANTLKNPFFQYQSLQRLSNLVTTRSNVYAVWITVGYFEVEKKDEFNPASQAHIYPEGYTFGQELGIDTGEVKRHRGFYIIDRSIPVGFMPGKNLNAENAVLLKRFIE
ncbi:MAG: hypothetical protein QM844_08590, partial [Planctomycetota bacterium]|nr:hypothetical protein [Planctomycetota bacterium]